jgi:hypothetical protein
LWGSMWTGQLKKCPFPDSAFSCEMAKVPKTS